MVGEEALEGLAAVKSLLLGAGALPLSLVFLSSCELVHHILFVFSQCQ